MVYVCALYIVVHKYIMCVLQLMTFYIHYTHGYYIIFILYICTYFVTDGRAYIIIILQEWTAQALWFQTISNLFCSLMYYEKSYT